MKKIYFFIFILSLLLASPAQAALVGFSSSGLWLQPNHVVIEGSPVKVYANLVNGSFDIFRGELSFYANDVKIGEVITFDIGKDQSHLFNIVWQSLPGEYKIRAEISNHVINNINEQEIDLSPEEHILSDQEVLLVDYDTDSDGLGNQEESALGTDYQKADTDGDGYGDKADNNPLDSKIFPGNDTDGDKTSDLVDSDIDNDALYNWEEEKNGTDPYKRDSDSDGVLDKLDSYPLDRTKWQSNIEPERPKSLVKAEKDTDLDEIRLSPNDTSEIEEIDNSQEISNKTFSSDYNEEKFASQSDLINPMGKEASSSASFSVISKAFNQSEKLITQTLKKTSNIGNELSLFLSEGKVSQDSSFSLFNLLLSNNILMFIFWLLVASILGAIISFILAFRAWRRLYREKRNSKI